MIVLLWKSGKTETGKEIAHFDVAVKHLPQGPRVAGHRVVSCGGLEAVLRTVNWKLDKRLEKKAAHHCPLKHSILVSIPSQQQKSINLYTLYTTTTSRIRNLDR